MPRTRTSQPSSSYSQEARYAQLELELQNQMLETYQETQDLTSTNTLDAYSHKIKEFKQWCNDKGFRPETCEQVTGPKLHSFLLEKVYRIFSYSQMIKDTHQCHMD